MRALFGQHRGSVAVAATLAVGAAAIAAGLAEGQEGDAAEPAASSAASAQALDVGRRLYADDCQSCHGPRGEGVTGTGPQLGEELTQRAGPALTDVGAASVDLYLTTGYMPLDDPREQPERTEPDYSEGEIDALVAYVVALGGPGGEPIPEIDPAAGDLAEGQELFADKCAGCHQIAGEGGLVVDGVAPELRAATETQIAEAVRVGPYVMPPFGPSDIDAGELDSLVRYVISTRDPRDEGGWGIGHIGPIPEGLAAWIVAALGLVAVAMVIGRKLGDEEG